MIRHIVLLMFSTSFVFAQSQRFEIDVDWQAGDPPVAFELAPFETDIPLVSFAGLQFEFTGSVSYDLNFADAPTSDYGDSVWSSLSVSFEPRLGVETNQFQLSPTTNESQYAGSQSFTGDISHFGWWGHRVFSNATENVPGLIEPSFQMDGLSVVPSEVSELSWNGTLAIEYLGVTQGTPLFDEVEEFECTPSQGDINNDGVVGFADFLLLSSFYGRRDRLGDINCNGIYDFADFLILSNNYGQRMPPSQVPEPASNTLVFVVAFALLTNRTRRR